MDPFVYDLPVFFIAKEYILAPNGDLTIDGAVSVSGDDGNAFAIFTDRDGAERFRDAHFPDHFIFEVQTLARLKLLYRFAALEHPLIAFDPHHRFGLLVRAFKVEDCLRWME